MNDACKTLFKSIVFILTVILAALLLSIMMSGCRTTEVTREIPVITEQKTERLHTELVRDTIMMRDSTYHFVQGDTVIIERWHHVMKVNKEVVADTIRDTIPQVVTVTRTEVREVNKPPWWLKALAWAGGITMAAVAIRVIFWIKK